MIQQRTTGGVLWPRNEGGCTRQTERSANKDQNGSSVGRHSIKKVRLEDKHLDEEKEGEIRFAVNLFKAMDTPVRGKGSSCIQEAKKVLETTKTTTDAEKTT